MGQDKAAKTLETHKRFIQSYGERELKPRREPMRELISTMLSHRTTHADEELAYNRMRERFPTWEAVRDAPTDELTEAISPSRYPGSKAPNIQKTLSIIIEERGKANIDFLRDMSAEEGLEWLTALPGVGIKTASLVLLFCFRKPILPVDTHVHRISGRVGLIGPKVSAEKAHKVLLEQLPKDPETLYTFHVNMLRHGQKVCTWSNPKCQNCPLTDICDWYQENQTVPF